jgi:hypothetical protein
MYNAENSNKFIFTCILIYNTYIIYNLNTYSGATVYSVAQHLEQ